MSIMAGSRAKQRRCDVGAQLVEYVLLVLLVLMIALTAVKFFGERVSVQYSKIVNKVDEVM